LQVLDTLVNHRVVAVYRSEEFRGWGRGRRRRWIRERAAEKVAELNAAAEALGIKEPLPGGGGMTGAFLDGKAEA
jgi:hypothetical protein